MLEARSRWGKVLLQVVLTLMVIPFAFPLVVMVQGSLAGEGWRNYLAVLSVPRFPKFFINSTIIAASVIVIVYAVTMMAAYGFSRLRLKFREIYFWMLLACLTLPEVVLLTPLFVTATQVGLYNTRISVILPLAALQVPFAVLLTRNYISGIPDEMFQAAQVDGAGSFRTFRHVVLPLTRPIGAAIVIFTLIGAWNAYLMPLVFLQSPDLQTITLVPQFFVGQFSNDQTKILASAVIIALPTVIAYLSLQKLFERGLAAGALK